MARKQHDEDRREDTETVEPPRAEVQAIAQLEERIAKAEERIAFLEQDIKKCRR